MTSKDLDIWFRKTLNIDSYEGVDVSKNGLQVDNNGKKINKVAFAVDACALSFEKAKQAQADMLFVHHGLFWKDSFRLVGSEYKRIKILYDSNIALYACHLPLDGHSSLGHNAGIATMLGLIDQEPFVFFNHLPIGIKGQFESEINLNSLLERLFPNGEKPLAVLPFGPKKINRVGIVSGGASKEVYQAIEEDLDVYITGEISHEVYHPCLEKEITMIAGGHYYTETIGLKLLSQKLGLETGLETVFIEAPTGL